MTADFEKGASSEDAGAASGALSRIAGVLFAPGETFKSIAKRPTFGGALAFLVIVSLICSALTMPRIDFTAQARQQMAKQTNMSQADKDRGLRIASAIRVVFGYAGPVLVIAWWMIVAAIILLLFRLFGAEGTYTQAFAIKVYSTVPGLIGKIVLTIVVLARGHVTNIELATLVRSNLGFLVDPMKNAIAFAALSSIDVFAIWSLILATIGYAYMAKVSKGVSAAVIFGLKVAGVLFLVGFVALAMQFQPS